jgi:hypothetical protein
MSKTASWLLIIYALLVTGIAGFEAAYIGHLQFIISILLHGSSN